MLKITIEINFVISNGHLFICFDTKYTVSKRYSVIRELITRMYRDEAHSLYVQKTMISRWCSGRV